MDIAKKLVQNLRFYYGWIIVIVALISTAFWLGIRSSFSVFYVALLDEFSWNRGDSAGVQSMALITYTLLAPIIGALIDRFGPRLVIVPGILILSLGLSLCALLKDLFQFYLLYGVVMGAGISCIGIVSYSAIIAHWFEKKRGLASGVALSGMGLGTFFLVPISQQFISLWGWRSTFILTGCLVLIILLPLNGLLLRHKPRELGLHPDGVKATNPSGKTNPLSEQTGNKKIDWTLSTAIRTPTFWALFSFPFLSIIGIYLVLVHNVRFMVDQGINRMTAAMIFASAGIISSLFRVFWGWLSDRIGRETTYTLGMLCICLALGSLIFIETTGDRIFIYFFLMFFGMGWGVSAPMFMAVAADLFRGRGFGLIYGIVEGGIGIAGALGAWMGGVIFDHTGSYKYAFGLGIILMILSSLVIWIAAPRKVHPKR